MLKRMRSHLRSNEGSEYTQKIILIAIAFIIGGLLIGIMSSAFSGSFGTEVQGVVQDAFNW